MTIREMVEILEAKVVVEGDQDLSVESAYTSDLLSDIMGNAEDAAALITMQAHKNTVAVAAQLDMPVVIICNNRPIPEDMQSAAEDNGIAILQTDKDQFTVSGILYKTWQDMT